MNLRKAIVVDTHPEDNSVDLVMCDDGACLVGIPVLAQNASTRTGVVDLSAVPNKKDGDAKWDISKRTGQDMEAVVCDVGGGGFVVVGFLFPQISQQTFADERRRFSRHQSDVYHTITGDGDIELFHPSGAYARIAQSTAHEDLEGQNFDKNLKLDRNTDRKVSIYAQSSDGASSVLISSDGSITINASAGVTIKAPSGIECITPVVHVTGDVVADGDVLAGQVSLRGHVHTGVKAGSDLSGPPAGGGGGGGGGSSSMTASGGTYYTGGTAASGDHSQYGAYGQWDEESNRLLFDGGYIDYDTGTRYYDDGTSSVAGTQKQLDQWKQEAETGKSASIPEGLG